MSDDDRKISVGLAPRARPRGAATALNAAERSTAASEEPTFTASPAIATAPAVDPTSAPAEEKLASSRPAAKKTRKATPAKGRTTSGKVQVGVDVHIDTRGRARAAYRFAQFYERVPTFSEFVENAIEAEIRRIEELYNNGDRLTPEADNLPAGRPPTR